MRVRNTVLLLLAALAIGVYIYFFERKTPSTDEARDLQDKVLPIESEEVDKVSLVRGGSTVTCEKKIDGTWEITEPLKMKADSSQVQGIISRATSLRKQREFEITPEDAEKYGLQDPGVRLRLWHGDSETEIQVGDEAPLGNNVYVAQEGTPRAFLVPKGFSSLLDKDVNDLRDRTVLEVAVPSVTGIRAASGEEKTEAVKEAGHWNLVAPVRDHADDEKAAAVLNELKNLRIVEFIEEEPADLERYGLARPPLEVVLLSGDGEQGKISFGDVVEGDEKSVYAQRSGAENVFSVAKSSAQNIRKNVLDLRSDTLFRADKGEIEEVTVRKGEEALSLRKEGAAWKIVQPLEADAEATRVDQLLGDIIGARVTEYAGSGEAVEKKYGLKEPEMEVLLKLKDGATEEASFGRVVRKVCYARREGGDTVLGVAGGLMENLDPDYLSYIKREVLSFDGESVVKLTLKRDDGKFTFERRGPGKWSLPEPGAVEVGDTTGRKLDSILVRLSHLRAKSYVVSAEGRLRKYGLQKPLVEASVELKGGEAKTVMIGKRTKAGYYAMMADGTMIFTVPDSLVDSLTIDLAGSPEEKEVE